VADPLGKRVDGVYQLLGEVRETMFDMRRLMVEVHREIVQLRSDAGEVKERLAGR
jgi:hypothetical protein